MGNDIEIEGMVFDAGASSRASGERMVAPELIADELARDRSRSPNRPEE